MNLKNSPHTLGTILAQSLRKTNHFSTAEVERILRHRFADSPSLSDSEPLPFSNLWSFTDLEVDEVSCLKNAPELAQKQVAHDLAYARFTEAYAIEKAGMSFAAKMSLLAPTLSEQKLYSLFAAEEARHFHFIDRSLGHPKDLAANPFIELLHNLILTGERSCLLLLVQVVLEGWGVEHYAKMANTCQHEETRRALRLILADEAAHHGSGLSLFNAQALNPQEHDYLLHQLTQFLKLVAIGPVGVIQILETHLGPFSLAQKQHVLKELRATETTQYKLNLLKGLLHKAGVTQIIEQLEQRNAFTPNI